MNPEQVLLHSCVSFFAWSTQRHHLRVEELHVDATGAVGKGPEAVGGVLRPGPVGLGKTHVAVEPELRVVGENAAKPSLLA